MKPGTGAAQNALTMNMSVSIPPRRTPMLWISWNFHRRTAGLCDGWGIPLHVLHRERSAPLRWLRLIRETVRLLRTHRPELLFVQNPSLVLTVLAVLCRRPFGYSLVVDAHNEGVRPFDRPYAAVRWITRRLLKAADVTIVTNDALATDVQAAGGYPVVLSDRLPEVPAMTASPGVDAPDIAVIATYRPDEPIGAIMAAAAGMPDVRFAFSGPAGRYRGSSAGLPSNVRLTGYLDEPEFWNLLSSAKVICDLTLKPDCLVCGAYEALALAKPMVLSEGPANRRVFGPAAVFTDNSPKDIAAAFRTALDERQRLADGARALRSSYPARWQADATAAWDAIRSRAATGRRRTA